MTIIRIDELPSGSGNLTPDDLVIFMNDPSGSKTTGVLWIDTANNNVLKVSQGA